MDSLRKNILVSIIIPVYNGEHTLSECLNSVCQSEYPHLEMIVVDDHSTDDSLTLAHRFPCKVIARSHNAGAAAARNQGAKASHGEILFFLDADIVVEKNTIEQIVQTFHDRPDISALFCSYQKDTIPSNFCSQYKNLVHHYTHQTSCPEAATFCGGFGAIKREVFLHFGGFDERYRSLEDIELGYRLHQAGHKIYLNREIQVTHGKRYSLIQLIQSDLFRRAIPWTKIMLQKRIFRNDLNTKVNNVLSVPVAFVVLLLIPLAVLHLVSLYAVLVLAAVFVALNLSFYRFVFGERGVVFTVRAVLMNWLGYLYSGVGLVLGIAAFVRESYVRVSPQPSSVSEE